MGACTSAGNRRSINYNHTIKQTFPAPLHCCNRVTAGLMREFIRDHWKKPGVALINSRSHVTSAVYLVVCVFYWSHKLVNFNLRIFAMGWRRGDGKRGRRRAAECWRWWLCLGLHAFVAINCAGADDEKERISRVCKFNEITGGQICFDFHSAG